MVFSRSSPRRALKYRSLTRASVKLSNENRHADLKNLSRSVVKVAAVTGYVIAVRWP
jgi:hypothetical protein